MVDRCTYGVVAVSDLGYGSAPAGTAKMDLFRQQIISDINTSRLLTVVEKTSGDDLEVIAEDVDALLMSNGTYSLLLPPSPTIGTVIHFVRQTAGAGTLTIARNGKNINGVAANTTVGATIGSSKQLIWSGDATLGWWSFPL